MDKKTWPDICHDNIEKTIAPFKKELPGWWYSLGECQVSCDASCAPTKLSDDMRHIPIDDRFNSGFHADVPQPSTLSDALLIVLHDALAAKAKAEGDPERERIMEDVVNAIWEKQDSKSE